MRLRLFGALLAAFTNTSALACQCFTEEATLSRFEADGFPPGIEVFHAKVSRWINAKEVEVEVIEVFASTSRAPTRRLTGAPGAPGDGSCAQSWKPNEVGSSRIFLSFRTERGHVITSCTMLSVTEPAVKRLRSVAVRPLKTN